MAQLRVHLLGEFRLEYGQQRISGVNSERLRSLLAYLLLHHQSPQPRKYLAFQFWPDSTERQAHTNLRKLLFQLRQALPDADSFLLQDHLHIQWRWHEDDFLDVSELQTLLALTKTNHVRNSRPNHTIFTGITQLYQGELLPGCHDEWILPLRQQLHRDVMQALEHLIGLAEYQREYRAGIHYAQHLLGLDSLHESTYRRLMQLHALNGDRAAALRAYHTCASLLQRELGVEPSEETHSLYLQILNIDEQPNQPPTILLEAPLIGREAEWHTLSSIWRQVGRARAHFVSIAGEAGIGKTRLAEELIAWASAQGSRVARTRSYEAEGGLAYAPVTEWLRSPPIRAGFGQLDKLRLGELARLLPELLTENADLVPPAPLREGWQRQYFFETLARTFLAIKGPLLLVIDDLQWCDQETLACLRFLLRYDPQGRLLIVGTWRSEQVDETHPLQLFLRDLANSGQLTTLHLAALTATETAALAQHFAQGKLNTLEIQQLYESTEGHPLFIVETVRAELHPASAQPNDAELSPPQPSKIQTVIHARLAQLSPQARELAGLAATIGRRFPLAVLAHASQSEEETLVRALDELWQRRILREQGTDAYDFSHDKIREIAYAELSQVRRRFWHRRVAEALESVYGGRLDEVSGEVASQFEKANVLDKAASYWQRAGEGAVAHFALSDAAAYLGRALDLLPAAEWRQRYELLLTRVKLYNHLGMRNEGRRDLDALQALVSAQDDHTEMAVRRRAEVALCLADFHRGLGEHPKARVAAQNAAALAEACADVALAAQAYFLWGLSAFWDDAHFAQARPQLESALALARQAGLQQSEAEVLIILALYGLYTGEPIQQIKAAAQQSLALYQQLGHPTGEAGALAMLGYIIYTQREGKYDLGIDYCERALEIVANVAGWDAERLALGNLGQFYTFMGDYGRAKPFYERELAITRQVQNWRNEAGVLFEFGCLYFEQGDYARAEEYLAQSLQLYQEKGSEQHYRVKVLGQLALLYHQWGENSRARAYGEEARRIARQVGDPRIEGNALTRLGRVLVSIGLLDEAAAHFQQALSNFQRMEQVNHSMIALAGLAEVALHQDKLADAQSRVETILTHLQTHQMDRTDEELYVYMVSYRVVCAAKDSRAGDLLQIAAEQLQTRAASLENEMQKQIFWSAPVHAEILAATQQKRGC